MVPNTSDDLPDPETPVNTVSRRLGISTLTSFRLFTRAPWTRIKSWLSAGWWLEEVMVGILSSKLLKQVDELPAHHLPAVARTAKVLLLVRLEARLHEGQAGARRRGSEREGH